MNDTILSTSGKAFQKFICHLTRPQLDVTSLFIVDLTDLVVENRDLAWQQGNRHAGRWAGCETSVQFLKSQMGLERFAVRRYHSLQGLIFLASLAMGFLSYLLSRRRKLRQKVDDAVRYGRRPKSFWFYRVVIALRDAFNLRAQRGLLCWCRRPP